MDRFLKADLTYLCLKSHLCCKKNIHNASLCTLLKMGFKSGLKYVWPVCVTCIHKKAKDRACSVRYFAHLQKHISLIFIWDLPLLQAMYNWLLLLLKLWFLQSLKLCFGSVSCCGRKPAQITQHPKSMALHCNKELYSFPCSSFLLCKPHHC